MNVQQLAQVLQAHEAPDALPCKLSVEDWRTLSPYLSVRFLKAGDPLMNEGDSDRELYILADGELQVSIHGNVIATLHPGTVVGEGTFFSGQPRSATVTPSCPGVAWSLAWDRFEAMSRKQPTLAMDLTKGLAAVLAIRMRQALLVGHFA